MSSIGRVFIVLNLVLAALFLGWSAFYLQRAESNKKLLLDEQRVHTDDNTKHTTAYGALTSENNQLKTDLARSNEQNNGLKANVQAKDAENSDLKGRLTNVETKVTEIAASSSAIATQLENVNKDNKELTAKMLAGDKDKNDALAAKADAEARLASAENENKKAEEKIAALGDEVRKQSDENRVLGAWKQNVTERFPVVHTMTATPSIDGQVLAVDANLKLATISVGEANAEVKPGFRFSVYNGRDYKGEVEITDVSDKNAFGNIIRIAPGKSINVGDKATTRLSK